jgi:tetratricopeptide (TPR) repeat protein
MKNISPLAKKAVDAAKNKDWNLAVEINEEILEADPRNVNALNRLALARMQLGHNRVAEKLLTKVLELNKHNKIASKNLERVKKKIKGPNISFAQNFASIEEPGKARVIELIRPANKKTLSNLSIGQNCTLEPKNEYISIYVETENNKKKDSTKSVYLGALPQNISARLTKLIKNGNEYRCTIHSINSDSSKCKVLVKECKVSEANQGITSFPVNQQEESDLFRDLAGDFSTQDETEPPVTLDENEEEINLEVEDNSDDDLD